MSALDSISASQLILGMQGNNTLSKADVAGGVNKLIEATFIEYMMKDVDLTQMGSVLNESGSGSSDSLLVNQVLMKMMLEQQ